MREAIAIEGEQGLEAFLQENASRGIWLRLNLLDQILEPLSHLARVGGLLLGVAVGHAFGERWRRFNGTYFRQHIELI
jgi:hypothetical protein